MRTAGVLPVLLLLLLFAFPVDAVEVELWPETYFQLQQYRDAEQLAVDKTRFTQYLTLNLFESAEVPQHVFQSQMRIDFDLGADDSPDANPSPVQTQRLDLMYAFYEWRRIGDVVDIKVGRQILTDEFGFYPLDGFNVSIWRDWYVGVDLYAGLEVKDYQDIDAEGFTLPNPSNFEPDGTYGESATTGTFGAALFLTNVENTQARVSYRHSYSGASDQERVGLVLRQQFFDDLWELYTVNNFDVFVERFDYMLLGTSLDFKLVTLALEHEYSRPIFDSDSIFVVFPSNPQQEFKTRLSWDLDKKTRFRLGYTRLYQGDEYTAFSEMIDNDRGSHLGSFSFLRQLGDVSEVHASYDLKYGWGGDYHWVGAGGGSDVLDHRIRLQADWSGMWFNELLYSDLLKVSDNEGFSWGIRAKALFQMHEDVALSLIGEVNSNQYVSPLYSMFAVLEVHSWL